MQSDLWIYPKVTWFGGSKVKGQS